MIFGGYTQILGKIWNPVSYHVLETSTIQIHIIFRPEEVEVSTKSKKITIRAKHESKQGDNTRKYEFHQEFSVPEGVKAEELKCRYMADGNLVLEAPYTEVAKEAIEPPKEQEITVKHE